MKFGVLRFPGSNCDQDAYYTIKDVLEQPVKYLWHADSDLRGVDCVVVPGGFSYGDYLRCGAIARFAPMMAATQDFAERGGLVLGICNGFQIITDGGLLPGVLMRNADLKFICKRVHLRVERTDTAYASAYRKGQAIDVCVAHGEGNYFCGPETLTQLEGDGLVAFRYCDAAGKVGAATNPNGSLNNIAGIYSPNRRVLGMMPHPENLIDPLVGGIDGRALFASLAA